ncbi:unnamed protein product, partial [marine sediment metagenome]
MGEILTPTKRARLLKTDFACPARTLGVISPVFIPAYPRSREVDEDKEESKDKADEKDKESEGTTELKDRMERMEMIMNRFMSGYSPSGEPSGIYDFPGEEIEVIGEKVNY